MFATIYEKLTPGQSAVYQIKFKGRLSYSLRALSKRYLMTNETSDLRYPVTMLTGEFTGQSELLRVLNALHNEGHSIIYLACVEITASKDTDNRASV